jgi:hypothetical protein
MACIRLFFNGFQSDAERIIEEIALYRFFRKGNHSNIRRGIEGERKAGLETSVSEYAAGITSENLSNA